MILSVRRGGFRRLAASGFEVGDVGVRRLNGLGFSGHGAPAIRGPKPRGGPPAAGTGQRPDSRSEVYADAGGPLDDAGADLEQVLPEGCELGPGERHPAGRGIAQGEHQPVGRGVQDEAELVGERALAGGPVGGELDLVLLDKVLGLSAGAVQAFVEMACVSRGQGDDVAGVEAARGGPSQATTHRSRSQERAA